eukprot:CAMPEP_0194238504 /NCGR_PEP_ID=MMETSP0158-20130606/5237_1 /TAXON_ID=33649 /ORGANISM="Thalassionema nitzschioides, Strain L26-B" /LENGTH=584 /DNA_ID=CAMNT_0038972775 /DNA_START=24 /DNA_END=1775 /DNA_ORIENTATION=-
MVISRKNKRLKHFDKKRKIETKNVSGNQETSSNIDEDCALIAELCESILEDPSSAFSSSSSKDDDAPRPRSKMRKLLEMANIEKDGTNEFTARLSIMSLVAIFQDIIPTFRIRPPTAEEMSVRVTKETKKVWDYERSLLQTYQQYLKLLERTWDLCNTNPLGVTAILALCELLKAAPHFNFRSNILSVVVRQMNFGQSEEVSEACCSSIEHLFRNDAQGDVALEAARLVCKLIRDRKFLIKPRVLQTFVSLPLRVHVDEAQAAKLASQANAKKRKRNKEEAEIEAELNESSGLVGKILLAKSQSDTLESVTVTYFQILKSENLSADKIANLLPVALEGLAKFAHLINMDTVLDLLEVLKTMLKRVDELPLDASLNCVLTAFKTLQGPGRELKIDQKEYITPLYTQLSRVSVGCNRPIIQTALSCLELAFIKRREYSSVRIASFLKRLLTVSLQSSPDIATTIIVFCRQLLQRYSSLHQLLENEEDVITSGQYDPLVDDPEHANPYATACWELAALVHHYHPRVAAQADRAANLKLLQLPMEQPERIQNEMHKNRDELYMEMKFSRKKHPLAHKEGKRQQVRFIS